MDIYLELRMDDITVDGLALGLRDTHKVDSIKWKERSIEYPEVNEIPGTKYNIYLEGIYEDPMDPSLPPPDDDNDISMKVLAVTAEYQLDPSIVEDTQIGGFVPRETTSGIIKNIPLHITINMYQRTADITKKGIDGMNPMEGGIQIQMAINTADPKYVESATADKKLIATATLEDTVVHELYEYIENECNEV